jgi:cGMP-dependent protein kinase
MGKYIDNRQESEIQNKIETQFYIASLFIILNYLNSKSIIHRDLKPDNIMINEKGYLKLIDFGTAIILKDFISTITGTPHYIAPEVLLGKGYNSSCDYWSLGIIAHELYYNYYPFGNDATNPMDIYRQVLKREVNLSMKGDPIVNSFIRSLLKKKTSKRLCSLDLAKKHSFFKDYNWEDLFDFKVKPPYIPKVFLLKKFEECTQKYEEHIKIEILKKDDKDTLLSSYDDDIDYDNIKYPINWVDEF